MPPIIFSCYQAQPLLDLRGRALAAGFSTDLGISRVEVKLEQGGLVLPSSERLPWHCLEHAVNNPNGCFTWDGESLQQASLFSSQTGRLYSLFPTEGAPTMLVSGIPMHRIKGTTPDRDTAEKLKAAGWPRGDVLDTATGLGYTAIAAARRAASVVTIELDPVVLELVRLNPWSDGLFGNPTIEQRLGDSSELVLEFAEDEFDCILHDPPVIGLAGELYGLEFYRQLHRVLRPGGRLFHYIGDPRSTSGRRTTSGAARRLFQAGFHQVLPRPRAFGLVAIK